MQITIHNIGQVDYADIVINGLTVIAGENNTGKSTLNRAIYAAFSSLIHFKRMIKRSRIDSVHRIARLKFEELSGEDFFEKNHKLREKINEIFSKTSNITSKEVYDEIIRFFNDVELNLSENEKKDLKQKLDYHFSLDDEKILVSNATNTFISEFYGQFSNINHPDADSFINLSIKNKVTEFKIKNNEVTEIVNPREIMFQPVFLDESLNVSGIRLKYNYHSYYSTLKRNHIEDAMWALNRDEKMYGHNDKDGDQSLDLNNLYINEKLNYILNIISKIVPKTFQIGDSFNPRFSKKVEPNTISFDNISSGLKTFINIRRLLLNETLGENGILILDEPEINLHPEWQVIFAEIIVLIQKELGMHIVLTTHSPYFIQAIEVFSEKYELTGKTEYYISKIDDYGMASFDRATDDISSIYDLLAKPFETLNAIEKEILEKKQGENNG